MIRIQSLDLDINRETAAFQLGLGAKSGAMVTFIGLMRDFNAGEEVLAMELEHYPGMTEKALADIESEARGRWQLDDVLVIHRVGRLAPGDRIVLVATASAHRHDAFEACAFIMDFLKTRAPFWKKELSARGERWVEARASDETARQRWSSSAE